MENIVVGEIYSAQPDPKNDWVRCEDGNDGEEDYYRDVFGDDGGLIYCDGESVTVVKVDYDKDVVTLFNENNNLENEYFEISVEQFIEDFMKGGE